MITDNTKFEAYRFGVPPNQMDKLQYLKFAQRKSSKLTDMG